MAHQEFNTVDVVRLEVETDPTGLVNLVKNPSGELGGWGWITPVAGSALVGTGSNLAYRSPGSVASYFYTEPMPVTAGQYVAASWRDLSSVYKAKFEWLDASLNVLSSAAQTAYITGTGNPVYYGPYQDPASTAYCRLRFDHYANTSGGNPTAGTYLYFTKVTVAKAATSGALGTTRVNLVPNPSLETNASGWRTGPTSTIARTTAQAAVGSASLLFTAGTSINDRWVSTVEGTGGMPVTAGATYAVQFRSRAATSARTINVRARWYDTNGSQISTPGSGTNVGPTSTSAWSTFNLNVSAPIGAAYLQLVLTPTGAAAGEQHYIDAALIEAADGTVTYFDGATPNAGGIIYGSATHPAAVKARINLVTNPSFETNAAGWEGSGATIARVTSTAGLFGTACLQITGTGGGGAQQPLTAKMPVTAGQIYYASLYARSASVAKSYSIYIDWLNSGGSTIATTESAVTARTSTTEWLRGSVTGTAPSGATHARLRVPLAAAGEVHFIDGVLFEQSDWLRAYFDGATGGTPDSWTAVSARTWSGTAHASTSTQTDTTTLPYFTAASSNLSYIEPVPYLNILGVAHSSRVSRSELNAGTLAATILSRSLDPSQAPILRPGRRARLTALVDGTWETVIGGKLLEADVTYAVKDPGIPADRQARISIVLVDPNQQVANAGRPEGVATIDELPYVLEGVGVPWNVNGSGNQVTTATVTTYNENAKALDQVALTRDTTLGYAWMSRVGVLNAWDRDQIPTGSPVVLDEDDYSDIDLSFSTKDVINEVQITVQSVGTDGSTTETIYGPYTDDESIETWGRYRKDFTVTGLDSAAVDAHAAAILAAAATPRIRVNSITVPLNTLERMEARATLDLYDEVRVLVSSLGVDDLLRITSLDHNIETEKWMLTIGFSDEGGVAVPTIQPTVQSGVRPDVGVIELFAGSTAPTGKLLCDGASYAVADYPYLFAVIGYTYGGAGANFNVPNLVDRFPIGKGTKALGTSGGSSTVTLTSANLPPHAHTINHTHNLNSRSTAGVSTTVAAGAGSGTISPSTAIDAFSGSSGNGPGSSTPVNVLNPWLALTFVIRAI